ncbi:MAG: GNAT family N-acetyltransferase [Rhodobacteraceae bacterium]|jgi:hypothetical protein|uniref:GNAT family N-acetyltransferase n=1 Tax=Albidovulum sp. TaxID=1872424 RepID=UPI001E05A727|nr:GNAT family N-acetyltransferase [Paracoccaceae bacterium]MCC0071399.1 GNAT family N-acetyltransferase [Paracoccaceae bacterium]
MEGGTGRCLCGKVRFAFEGAPNWQAHCHCESCRRATASPFTSYFGVSHGRWHWTGTTPVAFVSSPGVKRHFCTTCGSPMAYEGDRWPHEIHFFAATLDDPAAFRPTAHVNWNEHLSWVRLADGLPVRHAPRRLTGAEDMGPILNLIREAFAYMDGIVDPPSSVHDLTGPALAEAARTGEVWVIDELGAPLACMVLTPKPGRLHIGKLAVAAGQRRKGLARQLLAHATTRAKALGLPLLEMQSRVELTGNHAAFEAMGFVRAGETAHRGYDRPTSVTFRRPLP